MKMSTLVPEIALNRSNALRKKTEAWQDLRLQDELTKALPVLYVRNLPARPYLPE